MLCTWFSVACIRCLKPLSLSSQPYPIGPGSKQISQFDPWYGWREIRKWCILYRFPRLFLLQRWTCSGCGTVPIVYAIEAPFLLQRLCQHGQFLKKFGRIGKVYTHCWQFRGLGRFHQLFYFTCSCTCWNSCVKRLLVRFYFSFQIFPSTTETKSSNSGTVWVGWKVGQSFLLYIVIMSLGSYF